MTPIQTNKPVFFNSSGEPLNGTIYIGQPDADPRTSPKTVTFRDSGGSTFTASQPLTTINGRITYNGKPIVALVDGEYSMLVFDSAGVQVDYSRSVNDGGTTGGGIGDFSEVTRVGLTLSEVKAFDVAVGEAVRSIGKVSATDNLGADWLVISATGGSGDDIDLIDFVNGLQGSRIKNVVYSNGVSEQIIDGSFKPESPTEVWTGSATDVPVSALSEDGPGWYILKTAIADLSILVLSTDGTTPQGGSTYVFGGYDYNAILTSGSPGNFRVQRTERDSPFSIVLETVTAIYKV